MHYRPKPILMMLAHLLLRSPFSLVGLAIILLASTIPNSISHPMQLPQQPAQPHTPSTNPIFRHRQFENCTPNEVRHLRYEVLPALSHMFNLALRATSSRPNVNGEHEFRAAFHEYSVSAKRAVHGTLLPAKREYLYLGRRAGRNDGREEAITLSCRDLLASPLSQVTNEGSGQVEAGPWIHCHDFPWPEVDAQFNQVLYVYQFERNIYLVKPLHSYKFPFPRSPG